MRKLFASVLLFTSLMSFGQNPAMDELLKLYNSHDFKSVIEKATPLLHEDPDNVDLNLLVGRSHADLKNFKEAVAYLDLSLKNDKYNSWQKAWALSYLGTCHFMMQNYEESKKSLEGCIQLNATKNATNTAYGQTLLFGFNDFYANWKTVETAHFRFHFQQMNETDIQKYTSEREAAYEQINGFFKSTLPKKIDFFVWQSNDDALKILRGNVGFAKPEFCVVHTHYQQTVGHEMTHVISNYTSEISSKTRLINEGTAVYFDLTDRDRLKLVKDWAAANNKPIAIRSCWKNGNEYADEAFYPLSGLFVKELLDRFGKDKFLEFFKNQTYENAAAIFGDQLDNVIRELENKINT